MRAGRPAAGGDPFADLAHALGGVVRHLPPGLQPPGAARIRPGRDLRRRCRRVVGRGLPFRHHVQARSGPVRGQPVPHGAGVVRPGLPAFGLELRDDAVAAQHPAHGLRPRPHADHPDRDPLLDGPGPVEIITAGLVVVVRPVVARRPGPQGTHQVDPVVEPLGPAADVGNLAGVGEIGGDGADADGEDRPAAGQLVQRRHLAGHLPRAPPGQGGEHGAEADAAGAGGHGRQQRPRVHAVAGLPDEHPVPPGLLGRHRLLQLLVRGPAGQHHASTHTGPGHGLVLSEAAGIPRPGPARAHCPSWLRSTTWLAGGGAGMVTAFHCVKSARLTPFVTRNG